MRDNAVCRTFRKKIPSHPQTPPVEKKLYLFPVAPATRLIREFDIPRVSVTSLVAYDFYTLAGHGIMRSKIRRFGGQVIVAGVDASRNEDCDNKTEEYQ
jgi:hypothetical protein